MSANPGETNETLPIASGARDEGDPRRTKRLRIVLLLLVLILLFLACLFIRYLISPASLPDLVALPAQFTNPPHYLFSIYGTDKPVGVAVSGAGDRIYVTETGGERQVKIFDRSGTLLQSFAPPRTTAAERSPVYLAVDPLGRVFVSDRLQHCIFVYDRDGKYLDSVLSPTLTLSKYIARHSGSGLPSGSSLAFNADEPLAYYQLPGSSESSMLGPDYFDWAPMGLRFDAAGDLLITDVTKDKNLVRILKASDLQSSSWTEFNPPEVTYGSTGQERGQFLFPNAAVLGPAGRLYVSDGNNGRISVWNVKGGFEFEFGKGVGDDALSLPRGVILDPKNRLYVVDAVGQDVKVFNVNDKEPVLLFSFGDFGTENGLFNYPNDIAVDATGRIYITDRENNRVQVWSY